MFANNVEAEIKELLLTLKYEWNNRPNMITEYEAKEEENRQLQLEIDLLRNMVTDYEEKEEENRRLQLEIDLLGNQLGE